MGIIIAAILGAAGGFFTAWLICRKLPQEKIREINYQRLQEEQEQFEARKRQYELEIQEIENRRRDSQRECEENILTNNTKINDILHELNALEIQKTCLNVDISNLCSQREDISNSLEQSKLDAEKAAKTFFDQQMALVEEQFDRAVEEAASKCQQDISDYDEVYRESLKSAVAGFQQQISVMGENAHKLSIELEALQKAVNTATEAAKREEEMRQQQNFYKLIIPESDMLEIAQLRSVAPYLRDKEALNKVIWKVYYEKPYTDMIGRVLGSGVKTGIYKITNIENKMCYVGQAVNAADRWKQHIKRGLGAETPTRNKLYPAMMEFGVENFTFELLEECPKDKLDQQEDYWQDFFHAKDFGYSIK